MTIKRVVAAALCAVVAVGCAKEYPPITSGAAEESFRAWMAKNDPAAERKENGIYLRFVERSSVPITPTADKSWLRVNYTLYSLNGLVGETRSSEVAQKLGTWRRITHFVDDLIPYYSKTYTDYPKVCEGLRSAFQYLRPGDSVRIYIPLSLGYASGINITETGTERGMSVNSAYQGESTGYLDRPCYFDLRLQEVIDDPTVWEQKIVQRYIHAWGISASDSVIRGVYMRVLQDDPKATPITTDSSVRYYYAARFLDNHLIKSDVTKVAQQANYFYYGSPASNWTAGPQTFASADFQGTSTTTSDSTYRKILSAVLRKAKGGQTIEWVSISAQFPYGSSGQLDATPQILPYQPRRMQMRLLRWDEKEDQAKYDWSLLY